MVSTLVLSVSAYALTVEHITNFKLPPGPRLAHGRVSVGGTLVGAVGDCGGVPLHVIKEFGRWKSEAYMIYITLSVDVLDSHVRKAQAQALVLEERK